VDILNRANIPTFPYPDTAVRLFNYMWRYNENLKSIYETPVLPEGVNETAQHEEAQALLDEVRASERTLLTEYESKRLLGIYGIPTNETRVAQTVDAAIAAAEAIGYPVVIKLHSETITHKTDVGGVKLNLPNADAVRRAFEQIRASVSEKHSAADFLGVTVQSMVKLDGYELIIGSSIDPQFGPVLLFGMGGSLVEVLKDRALGLPPLTSTLARRMMERTRIYPALKGVRGKASVDLTALELLLVRFSQIVVELPWIKEIDINPLIASPDGLLALDARVLLHDLDTPEDQLPKPAIRPYPTQYVAEWTAADGASFMIRPIRVVARSPRQPPG